MFADLEYSMIEQISKQNNSKLLYVLTHSNKDMDKDEIIDMINVGIKGVLEKHKNEKNDEIFRAMRANEENCIFENFHEKQNTPIFGIHDLFKKLAEISKKTQPYNKFKQANLNDDEFNQMVLDEADIRKKKQKRF